MRATVRFAPQFDRMDQSTSLSPVVRFDNQISILCDDPIGNGALSHSSAKSSRIAIPRRAITVQHHRHIDHLCTTTLNYIARLP